MRSGEGAARDGRVQPETGGCSPIGRMERFAEGAVATEGVKGYAGERTRLGHTHHQRRLWEHVAGEARRPSTGDGLGTKRRGGDVRNALETKHWERPGDKSKEHKVREGDARNALPQRSLDTPHCALTAAKFSAPDDLVAGREMVSCSARQARQNSLDRTNTGLANASKDQTPSPGSCTALRRSSHWWTTEPTARQAFMNSICGRA